MKINATDVSVSLNNNQITIAGFFISLLVMNKINNILQSISFFAMHWDFILQYTNTNFSNVDYFHIIAINYTYIILILSEYSRHKFCVIFKKL